MAVYAISFRIGDQGDDNARWRSVVDKCHEEAKDTVWEETTSLIIIESDKTTSQLTEAIYLGSDFIPDWDKLLVINLSVKAHGTKGNLDFPATLKGLMDAR